MRPSRLAAAVSTSTLLGLLGTTGCASRVEGPSPELSLRKIVLYQNGIGYFERTGVLPDGRLRMHFRDREVDDVLKSLVVVEEGLDAAREKPSTVSVRLEDRAKKATDEDATVSSLDLVLSRRVPRRMSIAYEVPTAIWKATYRIILPDARSRELHPGMALLQAWALIDNASDEDWNGVQISLATGAPLSFSTDLRTPQFIERPTVSSAPPPLAYGAVASETAHSMDRDGDGIPDSKDACPDEPGGPSDEASRDGCPQKVRIIESSNLRVLEQVHFERDGDTLASAAAPMLDEVARLLVQHPEIELEIEGHATADEKEPWVLGARRAGAVRAALVARGVKARLVVQSFGDTRPISDAAGEAGRSRNRRVEFHILPQTGENEKTRNGERLREGVERTGGAGAATQQVAGSVRYDITDPVTIARHSSNLVTVVNRYVPGEEVLLYRPDPAVPSSATHPFRAARLDNQDGLELQAGSVAIFSGGTFVGEGQLGHLNPGETTLLPYAVDGATDVRSQVDEAQQPLRIVAIARGILTVEDADVVTTRYDASVGQQPPARLVIRHSRRAGYDARDLPPGTESTPEAYTVPLPVRAGTHTQLVVEERRTLRRELVVGDTAAATLALYLHGSALQPDLQKRVQDLVTLRSDIDQREVEIASIRETLTDAAARSGELRESLRAVERTPRAVGLQKQLLEQLGQATRQVEDQSARLAEKTTAQSVARTRLSAELRELRLPEAPK
jgi:outer membrane protein OmpA-like peptidoglycan-associated protein